MPRIFSKEEVLARSEREKVKFVDLQFTDLFGQLKSITIPVQKLSEAIDNNVWFDGSSIEGFARIFESDMFLKLDLGTFAILPWTRENGNITARVICDVYKPDGEPYESDPRHILKNQMAKARVLGYSFNVGPELEFYLMKRDETGKIIPLPHDHAGYFDYSTDEAIEVRKDMTLALQEFGIEVEALHHEVGPGQHEIDFKYSDPLTTADAALTFKFALKQIARKHGLYVSFMPKPFFGLAGSGMHVHQSLFREGQNSFYDVNDAYHTSETCKKFIAGELLHIKAMNAVLNPTVNSYKRLVSGYEAPVYISWGQTNRSALVRIPRVNQDKPSATRAELRCPDPTANPYLAFAVMLSVGLDGLENSLTLPLPVEENVYEMTSEQMLNRGIDTLPASLYDSLKYFYNDPLMKEVFGDATFKKYYEIKMQEWESFRLSVTDWEKDNYLERY